MQGKFEHRAWLALIITIAAASCTAMITARSGMSLVHDLLWFPGAVEAGHIWRLFTYAFVVPDPLTLIFKLLILWFVLSAVEELWGSGAVLGFFLAATCLAAGSAMLLTHLAPHLAPPFLFGPGAALIGFMYVFGRHDPDRTFYLMLIIPIKARWFVVGYILIRVLFAGGTAQSISLVACECAGAAAALLLRAGILYLIKRQREQRQQALTLVETNTKLEREHAALWERFNKEKTDEARTALIANEREKTFDFTVCPAGDFRPADQYCQKCSAFGHCLARYSDTTL